MAQDLKRHCGFPVNRLSHARIFLTELEIQAGTG